MSCFTCQSCGNTSQFSAFVAATQPRAGKSNLHDILFDLLEDKAVVVREVSDFRCPVCGSTDDPQDSGFAALEGEVAADQSKKAFDDWQPR